MKGKINAFNGAKVYSLNGKEVGSIDHKTEVDVLEPEGKPAYRTGEHTKVSDGKVTGWIKSGQVIANYHE